MEKFFQLKVVKKAYKLALLVYKTTANFPSEEKFGITNQMRRASVSVGSDIAEGTKKKSVKERIYFHEMADTSLEELKFQIYLSYGLKYLAKEPTEELLKLAREVGRMLNSLNNSLK